MYGEGGINAETHPEEFYDFSPDNGWYDLYAGQKHVIINEFRGEIPFAKLLKMMDRNPDAMPRRNLAPYPFISKYILVTSCSHPRDIYHNVLTDTDKLAQLERRCKIIEILTPLAGDALARFPPLGEASLPATE